MFLRHRAQQTEFLVILGHFLPFYPTLHNNLKNQNFEKVKKNVELLSFYTCVPQMTIIWYMVPEKWSMTDRIFCHLGVFFALLPPLAIWKIKILKKMKKPPGGIIILHKCSINNNHMMYGSWDMECDRQNFLSFWTAFCTFTPLTTQKIKILKNWKKSLEISSFYTSVPKIMIICYTVP